jgi:enoyl-CoA hydratase/carnithine racemase
MFELFQYSTFTTKLEKSTRTLFVILTKTSEQNPITIETLFELESLFAWCTSRVEINSIYIQSANPIFSRGIQTEDLKTKNQDYLEKLQQKLAKITFSMMHLPQTVVVDLGSFAHNLALELTLGADIRIARSNADLRFNHAKFGLIPASGGMGFLSQLVSPSFAKKWILTGDKIKSSEQINSGLVHDIYDEETYFEVKEKILRSIFEMSPVARIQAKLGLYEAKKEECERVINNDLKIGKATLTTQDWKMERRTDDEFMPAKSFSYAVKLSLVKSDNITPLDH